MKRIALLLLALVAGCASMTEGTMNKIVDSWRGAKIEQVVKRWGIPDKQFKTANGTIYEWVNTQHMDMPGYSHTTATVTGNTVYANTYSTPQSTIDGVCTMQLTADKDDIVTDAAWQGNNCCFMAVSGRCASLENKQ